MTMHMTPFRPLPADPAWGAGCVARLRSLPMRDRARAMRPARYVGPAGKERFGAFVWFGLVRVGLRWVSGWDFGRDCARGISPPERVLSRTPLIIRTVDQNQTPLVQLVVQLSGLYESSGRRKLLSMIGSKSIFIFYFFFSTQKKCNWNHFSIVFEVFETSLGLGLGFWF